ncbi:MAG: hypothetical protein ACLFU8_06690 [Anaerolineales bacterium]
MTKSIRLRLVTTLLLLFLLACNLPFLPTGGEQGGREEGQNKESVDLGLTRANPYPYGEPAFSEYWEIHVREMIRGSEAWEILKAENPNNEPAPAGWEHVLLRLWVRSRVPNGEKRRLSLGMTGDRGVLRNQGGGVLPEPRLPYEFAQEQVEGWTVFLAPAGEGNPMLVFREYETDDRYRYVALEENARILVDLALDEIPVTSTGTTPKQAAALGETVTTEDWEITLEEVVTGEEAWEILYEANSHNDPPAEGLEYVLASVRARYIGVDEGPAPILAVDFATLGSDRQRYASPSVVEPQPAFSSHSLYPDGSFTGWVALLVNEGAEEPVLIVEPGYDDADRRYLRLTP